MRPKNEAKKPWKNTALLPALKYPAPLLPSHTATPFFHLTRLGECTFLKNNVLSTTPTASKKQSGLTARIPGVRRLCGWKDYSGKRFWTLFGRM
ncbi:MAG TPA: hypothetical protein PKL31_13815, partial [Fulvivirga sp.]|nr:hypothetical protein [Fulvivirga sp.]